MTLSGNITFYISVICTLTLFLFTCSFCWERKLISSLNPNCTDQSFCQNVTLVHIAAVGPNDTLHYVWSFVGKPSLLLALTNHSTELHISWNDFFKTKNHSVYFSEQPRYSFGMTISSIWEYNDVNDTGCLEVDWKENSTYIREYQTENFIWQKMNFKNDSKQVFLHVETSTYQPSDNITTSIKSGKIQLMLTGFGYSEHSEDLPRLLHTVNSTQVDMIVENLITNSGFLSSRFAVNLVFVSDNVDKHTSMTVDPHKSLDDEQAPGIFTIIDLQTPSSISNSSGGYLQWRPVAYIQKERDLSNSTDVTNYGMFDVSSPYSDVNSSLLYTYYFNVLNSPTVLVQKTINSFGLKQDGFYKKTNYTSWTFMMGYGTPPNEDFSMLVILVISIGLGLPALLIVISGIAIAVRRASQKNDELCLNR